MMLRPDEPLAIYMQGAFADRTGKMGMGALRYAPNPIVCLIEPSFPGQDARDVTGIDRSCPIVATVDEAVALGAKTLLLGIAPPGGLIPQAWMATLDRAVGLGLNLVNGLHDKLASRYPNLAEGQYIWDIRTEEPGLQPASGAARELEARRVLFIGTDMSVGKMTAGLEILKLAVERGIKAGFVATGQIGMVVTGGGVPLDAIRVDFSAGAIEREVLKHSKSDLILVEGQGSLIHPASSATMPLIRGSHPTHFVLCHRAGMETLPRVQWVRVPDLTRFARLYEDLAEACGVFQRPKTVAIALNTSHLDVGEAERTLRETQDQTGLPTTDPVRIGPGPLLDAILQDGPAAD